MCVKQKIIRQRKNKNYTTTKIKLKREKTDSFVVNCEITEIVSMTEQGVRKHTTITVI